MMMVMIMMMMAMMTMTMTTVTVVLEYWVLPADRSPTRSRAAPFLGRLRRTVRWLNEHQAEALQEMC